MRREVMAFDALAPIIRTMNEQLVVGDIGFYTDLSARLGPPVVELGVGDGRVARHVLPQVGVDGAPAALAQCRQVVGDRIRLIEADLADYELDTPARFSYASLNTFNHVVDEGHFVDVLRHIRAETEPGGFLAFDVALADEAKLRARNMVPVQRFRSPTLLVEDVTEVIEPVGGLVHIHIRAELLDGGGRVVERVHGPVMPFRFREFERLTGQLGAARWRVVDVWGSFERSPLFADSRTAICLVQSPG